MSDLSQQDASPGRPSISITQATNQDIQEIAACHAMVFPDEVIAMLGVRFLRAHHRFYATNPKGICLLARDSDSGRLMGFVIGGPPELRKRFILFNAIRFLPLMLYKAVSNSAVRHRVALGLRRVMERLRPNLSPSRRFDPPDPPAGTWSLLLYICTHPDYRRRGVAGSLLDEFRQASLERGFTTMRLTVLNDNESAIRCYQKNGWERIGANEEMSYFDRPCVD